MIRSKPIDDTRIRGRSVQKLDPEHYRDLRRSKTLGAFSELADYIRREGTAKGDMWVIAEPREGKPWYALVAGPADESILLDCSTYKKAASSLQIETKGKPIVVHVYQEATI